MNLSDELRTHIDRAAPPLTLTEVVTRSGAEPRPLTSDRGHRRPGRRWLVVAAALVVAATGALLLVPRADRDRGQQPVSADGTGLSPLTAAVGSWQELSADQAFPPFAADGSPSARPSYVTDMTAVPGGYVAVGSAQVVVGNIGATEGELADEITATRATAWASPDGRTWSQVPLEETPGPTTATTAPGVGPSPEEAAATTSRLDAVANRGAIVVAVGNTLSPLGSSPEAWRWEGGGGDAVRSSLPNDNGPGWVTMAGVVATSRAFVAAGTDIANGGGVVWASPDGITWAEAATFGRDVVLTSLTVIGDRLVAVGSVGGERPTATVWTSDDDGATWAPAELPASSLGQGTDGRTEMLRVASNDDGQLLAVGLRGPVTVAGSRTDDAHQIGLADEVSLWISDDGGLSWAERRTLAVAPTSVWRSTLTWGPAGFLLILSGSDPGLSWLTVDGASVSDAGYTAAPWIRATIGAPDAYIAVTDRDHGPDQFPPAVAVLPSGR